jgi:broad specificity phosphatase PhoE
VITGPPVKAAEPTDEETLAEAVRRVSAGVARLAKGGLNRRAVVALLHDASGVSKRTVALVLDELENLAKNYTR